MEFALEAPPVLAWRDVEKYKFLIELARRITGPDRIGNESAETGNGPASTFG
jgi:hypothetical protein